MGRTLIGDAGETTSYAEKLSLTDAQALADLALEELLRTFSSWRKRPKITVVYTGRLLQSLYGRLEPGGRTMTIHKLGENAGTVLHEVCHFDSRGHGARFKELHAHLLQWWHSSP